jgi:hypothetical protein
MVEHLPNVHKVLGSIPGTNDIKKEGEREREREKKREGRKEGRDKGTKEGTKEGRKANQALVAHACNPSYPEGRDQEDHSSKPVQANSS